MPGIDDLLRGEGERWRTEVDTHHLTTTVPTARARRRSWSTARGRVWTVSVAGVAAAAVIVLAVGLGSGSDGSGSSGSAASEGGASAALPDGAKIPPGAAAPRNAGSIPSAASGSGPTSAPTGTSPSSAALILTGSVSLTVRTDDAVDRAATTAIGIADGAGGRVDADTRTTATQHSATLVIRVPNTTLPGVIKQLTALGTVGSQHLQTRDVTTQVADVDSRVTSARSAIAALTRLYAKAGSVSELIAVESALSSRESNLEALEAQQRTLAAQTSLATLTLSVDVRAPAARHHTHHGGGFVGGLHSGWHAFTRSVHAVATGIGAALPFLVVVLVVAVAGIIAVRRRRPSHPTAADPDS